MSVPSERVQKLGHVQPQLVGASMVGLRLGSTVNDTVDRPLLCPISHSIFRHSYRMLKYRATKPCTEFTD